MKKTLIATALLAALSTSAFAGSFDGPFVELGLGGGNTSNSYNGFNITDGGPSVNSTSGSSFNGILSGGYSHEIGAGFNLAATLFYTIGNQNGGSSSTTSMINDGTGTLQGTMSANSTLKNTWGVSVEPGYYMTEKALGYVKLAYVNSSLSTTGSASITDLTSGESISMNPTKSNNVSGFGYGLGVKYAITDNVYVKPEFMITNYQSSAFGEGSSVKPTNYSAYVSVGYKF